MRLTNLRKFALPVAAALVAVSCGSSSSNGNAGAPTKVQIAAEAPWTGDQGGPYAVAKYDAIQLVIKQQNAKGGIHGTQIQLLTWDDQHNAATAATLQAQGISDPTVLGIIGPDNSGVVLATVQGLQGANPPLPFISNTASNPKITESGYSVAHRVCSRDDGQGPADAKFMIDKGAKKIEVMNTISDYGTGLADQVVAYLKAKAPNIVIQRDSAKDNQVDFSTIITRIKAFGPDWIFFGADNPPVAPFVQQLRSAGMTIGKDVNYMGTDGQAVVSNIAASQGAWVGAYLSNINPDPISLPSAASFIQEYKTTFPSADLAYSSYIGAGAESTAILVQAILRSPVKNGKISRADVLNQLNTGTFDTIFGPVHFDSKGDPAGAGTYMYQVSPNGLTYLSQVAAS